MLAPLNYSDNNSDIRAANIKSCPPASGMPTQEKNLAKPDNQTLEMEGKVEVGTC